MVHAKTKQKTLHFHELFSFFHLSTFSIFSNFFQFSQFFYIFYFFRFQVPYTNFENQSRNLQECDLQVLMDDLTLNFQIIRQKTGQVIFDTYNAGSFIFANQFLQISSVLTSKYIYGLGEHRKPFLKNTGKWQQFSFWNADQWPSAESTNLYGSHPFYINMEPETKSGKNYVKIKWLTANLAFSRNFSFSILFIFQFLCTFPNFVQFFQTEFFECFNFFEFFEFSFL